MPVWGLWALAAWPLVIRGLQGCWQGLAWEMQGFQLGAINQPLPVSDDELDGGDGSPKRRREGSDKNKQPVGDPGPPGLSLDMETMQRLLQDQCRQIVASNQAHLDQAVTNLEGRLDTRFSEYDVRRERVEDRVAGVEQRLQRMEEALAQRGPSGQGAAGSDNRRLTLVYGGWRQDTPRAKILAEVTEAVSRLGLSEETDAAPFTTGPRRSVALQNFVVRSGESMSDTRGRMHRLVQGIASAGITTSHGKRFWCSYSKTRAERDVASHASWVKRSLATKGLDLAARLDIEYSTGTVWMGEHTVASAKRPVPPNVDPASIIYDERLVVRPWVDVSALAMESGLTGEEIRGLLEANRN